MNINGYRLRHNSSKKVSLIDKMRSDTLTYQMKRNTITRAFVKRNSKKKIGGSAMKCKKCGGLLVLQTFFDHSLNFEGWKCLNCGKIFLKKEKTIEYDSFSIFYQQQKCRNRN